MFFMPHKCVYLFDMYIEQYVIYLFDVTQCMLDLQILTLDGRNVIVG